MAKKRDPKPSKKVGRSDGRVCAVTDCDCALAQESKGADKKGAGKKGGDNKGADKAAERSTKKELRKERSKKKYQVQ